jgi:hypothetical protein
MDVSYLLLHINSRVLTFCNSREASEACGPYLEDEEDVLEDSHRIAQTSQQVRDLLSRLNRPDTPELIKPSDRPTFTRFDLSALVEMRSAHETDRAKKAVRSQGDNPQLPHTDDLDFEVKQRSQTAAQLHRRLDALLREVNKPSEGTGSDRLFRWTGALSGNTANAALAAGQRADRVNSFLFTWCVH